MVVCCNSSREHENSSRQGRRAGLGGGVSTCVNEAVAAAQGGCFDVSSSVGCKKKEARICRQGTGWEQLRASL